MRMESLVALAKTEMLPKIRKALELYEESPDESIAYTLKCMKSVLPKLERYKSSGTIRSHILMSFHTLLAESRRIKASEVISPKSIHVPVRLLSPEDGVSVFAVWAELIQLLYLELLETDQYRNTPLGKLEINSRQTRTSKELVVLLLDGFENYLDGLQFSDAQLHYHDFSEVQGMVDRLKVIDQSIAEVAASSIKDSDRLRSHLIVPMKTFLSRTERREEEREKKGENEKNRKDKESVRNLRELLYEQVDKDKLSLLDHSYSFKWSFVPVLFAIAFLLVQTIGLDPIRTPLTLVSGLVTICLWSGYKYAQKEKSVELRLLFAMMLPTITAASFITFIPFFYIISFIAGILRGNLTSETMVLTFLGVFLIFIAAIHLIFKLFPSMWGKEKWDEIARPVYLIDDRHKLCSGDDAYWNVSSETSKAALRYRSVAGSTGWYVALTSTYIVVAGTGITLGPRELGDLLFTVVLALGMVLGFVYLFRSYTKQKNLATLCLLNIGKTIEDVEKSWDAQDSIRRMRQTPSVPVDDVRWMQQLIETRNGQAEMAKEIRRSNSPWRIIAAIGSSEDLKQNSLIQEAINEAVQRTIRIISNSFIPGNVLYEIAAVPLFVRSEDVQRAFGETLQTTDDIWTIMRVIIASSVLIESHYVVKGIVAAIQHFPRGLHVIREILDTKLVERKEIKEAIAAVIADSIHPWRVVDVINAKPTLLHDEGIQNALLERSNDIARRNSASNQ
ncbi:MAG: hypothetical protein ACW99U_16950 [Candidatus Thorarchaeota archaeon]